MENKTFWGLRRILGGVCGGAGGQKILENMTFWGFWRILGGCFGSGEGQKIVENTTFWGLRRILPRFFLFLFLTPILSSIEGPRAPPNSLWQHRWGSKSRPCGAGPRCQTVSWSTKPARGSLWPPFWARLSALFFSECRSVRHLYAHMFLHRISMPTPDRSE